MNPSRNLLLDPWLPLQFRDGRREYAAIERIIDPEVIDVAFPRADFQGAAWQFLIGLLETVSAPETLEDWQAGWIEPPGAGALRDRLADYVPAFDLFGDGPRFMQDLDPLDDVAARTVSALLIDAPGAKTERLNADHSVRRGTGEIMCPDCAAIALFTLQINAPSGGQGHRTGLRGGGPLTTLVLPGDEGASLWRRLWLNVRPREYSGWSRAAPDDRLLFPWLGPTPTSQQAGSEVRPDDVHPLHAYWAMPRRIRLQAEEEPCQCSLCGRDATVSVRSLRTRNYGINYAGAWMHPLTPYRVDPSDAGAVPLSIKGRAANAGYREWAAIVFGSTDQSRQPAAVVAEFSARHMALEDLGPADRQPRLWAFGHDMDNMKCRGWYSTRMPLLRVPTGSRDTLMAWATELTRCAELAAWQTRTGVRAAWYRSPKDARGDFSFIERQFYELTEPAFYQVVSALVPDLEAGDGPMPEQPAADWYRRIYSTALEVFDDLALSGDADALDMGRVIRARRGLLRWLNGSREMKGLRALAALDNTPEVTADTNEQTGGSR